MIYVKVEGIDGDVQESGHGKWIRAETLEWKVNRSIAMNTGGGGARDPGPPSITELKFTKVPDVATAKLFQEACSSTGKGKKVEIHLVTTDKSLKPYLQYTLGDCLVSGFAVSTQGSKTQEEVRLAFTSIEVKYTPYDDKHNAGSPIAASFNVATVEVS
jgi:type VI secretion system secreted protein Hcp